MADLATCVTDEVEADCVSLDALAWVATDDALNATDGVVTPVRWLAGAGVLLVVVCTGGTTGETTDGLTGTGIEGATGAAGMTGVGVALAVVFVCL